MSVFLPDIVAKDELLARIICDSSKKKKYEKTAFKYSKDEGRYIVNTSKFIDTRNPSALSVNRISTLAIEDAHKLGIEHKEKNQPDKTYHGFAMVTAKLCFDNNCAVEKDDVGGTLPYHANIIYPNAQSKEDNQEIAIQLAYNADFKKFGQ